MKNEETKSSEPTCKWCYGPLKPTDYDGVCSHSCAILSGEKSMGDEEFNTMFSFMRSGGFDADI